MINNINQSKFNKILLITLAIIIALMMALIPIQVANAATSESYIGKVQYNGSTYHARYDVIVTNNYADLTTTPYKFKTLTTIKLVQDSVTNGWGTDYKVRNLKCQIINTRGNYTNTFHISDYDFYKSAPTKVFVNDLNLPSDNYTLYITGKIYRGNYSSNINVQIRFNIL